MAEATEQIVLDFFNYPSVGEEDWGYAYATAYVRSLAINMLTRATLLDMANSVGFEQAVDLLASSEYGLGPGQKTISELEKLLKQRRSEVRGLFADLIINEAVVDVFKSRDDFANMRLALRRKLTDKAIGSDYSDEGSVGAEQFEQIFEEENYEPLPNYMKEALERAVLAYYQNKDVRQIDHAIDGYEAEFKIASAKQLESDFLLEYFRMEIDLTNIRTMLRLKFTEAERRDVFLEGGYVEHERLKHGLDIGYEAIAPLFFATPYHSVVEAGIIYFNSDKSFIELEQHCEDHLTGYLKSTVQITAGPQPLIAYLLMKEHEIRTVRFILTAKKNSLDTRIIIDRLSE